MASPQHVFSNRHRIDSASRPAASDDAPLQKAGAEPAEPADASAGEEALRGTIPDDSAFSALALRDRVVIMLLFDQIVSEERVAEAWTLWQQRYAGDTKRPLWRLLTLVPEVDRELIFAETARVYGIEEARISRLAATPLIERVHRLAPRALWDQMVERRLVPIAESIQNHSHRVRMIFASHDPTHAAVQEILPQLNLGGYELRYAPELEIIDLLAEAFPWKYKGLKEVLEAEYRLAAQQAAEAAAEAVKIAPPEAPGHAPEVQLLEGSVNSSSILAFFEDMLVEAVRQQAEGVCIVPNQDSVTELYLQVNDQLKQWRVVEQIEPSVVLVTIKSAVIHADFAHSDETQQQIIKRWIDGKLVRFRVSALPANRPIDLESIVIRVLR